jgi:L-asparaginase II
MEKFSLEPLQVEVTRGEKVESLHLVDVVIMNSKKEVINSFGQTHMPVYPRSAIKMLQALLLVESGAFAAFNLEKKHLALASSSHFADQIHTDLVHKWLNKLNLTEEHLRCGPQMPSRRSIREMLIRNNEKPHRGHNNCSGKHCGILSVCIHKNYDHKSYDQIFHPVQKDLNKLLSEVYEFDLTNSAIGIDGCGIPTIAVPLNQLNIGHINLLKRDAGKLILEAIAEYPELISGFNNFGTEVTKITNGNVFAKTGAEGVYCAFSPKKDIFISIKARDGATRASELAIATLLKEFGCFNFTEEEALNKFLRPVIKNWEGLAVGEMRLGPIKSS